MKSLPHIHEITRIKKVLISDFTQSGIKIVEENYVPKINPGQCLVKIHAAPINPLDILKVTGKSASVLPFTPGTLIHKNNIKGSEGSGTIIFPQSLRGRTVAFYVVDGSFKQYGIVNLDNVLMFPEGADLDQISCGFVNPMTCNGLCQTARDLKAQCVVNTAANSQLGTMIYKVLTHDGIDVINLVRGENNVKQYQDRYNAKYVLNIESHTFDKDLKLLSEQLKAKVCFDCYGGELSGRILFALPKQSQQFCYGSLISAQIDKINAVDLRWADKSYNGFVLFNWLAKQSKDRVEEVKNNIINQYDTFYKSTICEKQPIENFVLALEKYRLNMSAGKVLLEM